MKYIAKSLTCQHMDNDKYTRFLWRLRMDMVCLQMGMACIKVMKYANCTYVMCLYENLSWQSQALQEQILLLNTNVKKHYTLIVTYLHHKHAASLAWFFGRLSSSPASSHVDLYVPGHRKQQTVVLSTETLESLSHTESDQDGSMSHSTHHRWFWSWSYQPISRLVHNIYPSQPITWLMWTKILIKNNRNKTELNMSAHGHRQIHKVLPTELLPTKHENLNNHARKLLTYEQTEPNKTTAWFMALLCHLVRQWITSVHLVIWLTTYGGHYPALNHWNTHYATISCQPLVWSLFLHSSLLPATNVHVLKSDCHSYHVCHRPLLACCVHDDREPFAHNAPSHVEANPITQPTKICTVLRSHILTFQVKSSQVKSSLLFQ